MNTPLSMHNKANLPYSIVQLETNCDSNESANNNNNFDFQSNNNTNINNSGCLSNGTLDMINGTNSNQSQYSSVKLNYNFSKKPLNYVPFNSTKDINELVLRNQINKTTIFDG